MIQNMRFLGYCLRGRLVEAIGRADGAIGRFAIGRPAGYRLWAMGYRREVKGERWGLFVFDGIKSLSEDATDVGLTDESIGINGLDDLEDHMTLVFAS